MSLFGSIGKLVGKGLKIAKGVVPGGAIAGGAIGAIGSKIAKRVTRSNLKKAAVGAAGVAAVGGITAAMSGGKDVKSGSYRRINPGNSKALRRAIRRVEAGARLFGKFYSFKKGSIKGAHGVRVKKLSIRRAA
jgi:hypothetical protein